MLISRLVCLLVALAAATGSLPAASADSAQVARGRELSEQARRLVERGERAKAEELLQQLVDAKARSFGPNSEELLPDLGLLASLETERGAYAEAEARWQQAMRILTELKRAESADMGLALSHLGRLFMIQGKRLPGELTLLKAIALNSRLHGEDSAPASIDRLNLATIYTRSFQLAKAQALIERALAAAERDEPQGARMAHALSAWGEWHFRQYRFAEAEAIQRRASGLIEQVYGAEHPELARVLSEQGLTLLSLNRFDEAEALMRRAINIYEAHQGLASPSLGVALASLGQLYAVQGRYAAAEQSLVRGLTIATQTSGGESFMAGTALGQLGYLYQQLSRTSDAIAVLERALRIWERPLTANPRAAAAVRVQLASAKRESGDAAAAKPIIEQALATLAGIFGEGSIAVADAVVERAAIGMDLGAHAEALGDFRRALDVWERDAGADHPGTIRIRGLYAEALAEAGQLEQAIELARQATTVLRRRIRSLNSGRAGSPAEEIRAMRRSLGIHVNIAAQLAARRGAEAAAYVEEAFQVGQAARATEAARAVARMTSRFAAGTDERADTIRQLQDTGEQLGAIERSLTAALGAPASDRNLAQEAEWRRERESLLVRLYELQSRVEQDYPDYARLTTDPVVGAATLRGLLQPGETMLVYLVLTNEIHVWAIDQAGLRLHTAPISRRELNRSVRALRRALDPREVASIRDLKPLDFEAAHVLYTHLVAPVLSASTRGIIVVPDGALQSLPLGLLLTASREAPESNADYRNAPWLGARYAIGVLPSASSLAALRAVARPVASRQRYIGIGNPVLSGEKPPAGSLDIADLVRSLTPLPDTADELRQVAMRLGADERSTLLAGQATEARVKAAPLADYRILHFATHGLMAGDFAGLREPALVMTPPVQAKGDEDGLLTASEIAQLRIDADWVILSACNTAAPDGTPGAEGLSGLAKAFFFAGSRTLLVSHWEVLSAAAVDLIFGMIEAAADGTVSRAEAQRRSIVRLIADESRPYLAHPIFWAPFVLVGEVGALGNQ